MNDIETVAREIKNFFHEQIIDIDILAENIIKALGRWRRFDPPPSP